MHFILAQIQTITNEATKVQVPVQKASQELHLIDLLIKGGVVMIPIAILLFIALYIFIERYLYIRKVGHYDRSFLITIREMLYSGNTKGAIDLCKSSVYPISKIIEKGLMRVGEPIRDIEHGIEASARIEIYNMEKNLPLLSAIAAIAPMAGFLGTVTGMIRAFHDISIANDINIGIISSGIYEKMITSACGLIVGILAHSFHTILSNLIDRVINQMEVTATNFIDLFYKPVSRK